MDLLPDIARATPTNERLTADAVRAWFESEGWRCIGGPPEMVFTTTRDMPEGYWRHVQVIVGDGSGRLAASFCSWAGAIRRLHQRPWIRFDSVPELALLVASCGPTSFRHVLDAMQEAAA